MNKVRMKFLVVSVLCLLVGLFYYSGVSKELSLQNIQFHLDELRSMAKNSPLFFVSIFSGIYFFLTSLAIPGTIVLTFLAGAIFGVGPGTLIVAFSATAGAGVSFLLSRYLFRDYIMKNFKSRFVVMDRKFRKSGKSYLWTLRLIPITPFICVNILMGLTSIRFFTFIYITFLGMIPGTAVYVFAGKQIAALHEPSDIFTPSIVSALVMIGLLPFVLKYFVQIFSERKLYEKHS